ncbi:hypothetical protein BOTBODRAFT_69846 [Botryobasidium botryosum FD-172 SS1]|uniref:Uncharacterized protein n=1 Tax=Botryobasidium botryosum (strain FD-172 SS1) TaxID=930990 RepID=A0A067M9T0_BOTB1|nr:hypothetical protein BOTBODRAFT_69846 [Botryobasidium botryosum FD-172 SS1]
MHSFITSRLIRPRKPDDAGLPTLPPIAIPPPAEPSHAPNALIPASTYALQQKIHPNLQRLVDDPRLSLARSQVTDRPFSAQLPEPPASAASTSFSYSTVHGSSYRSRSLDGVRDASNAHLSFDSTEWTGFGRPRSVIEHSAAHLAEFSASRQTGLSPPPRSFGSRPSTSVSVPMPHSIPTIHGTNSTVSLWARPGAPTPEAGLTSPAYLPALVAPSPVPSSVDRRSASSLHESVPGSVDTSTCTLESAPSFNESTSTINLPVHDPDITPTPLQRASLVEENILDDGQDSSSTSTPQSTVTVMMNPTTNDEAPQTPAPLSPPRDVNDVSGASPLARLAAFITTTPTKAPRSSPPQLPDDFAQRTPTKSQSSSFRRPFTFGRPSLTSKSPGRFSFSSPKSIRTPTSSMSKRHRHSISGLSNSGSEARRRVSADVSAAEAVSRRDSWQFGVTEQMIRLSLAAAEGGSSSKSTSRSSVSGRSAAGSGSRSAPRSRYAPQRRHTHVGTVERRTKTRGAVWDIDIGSEFPKREPPSESQEIPPVPSSTTPSLKPTTESRHRRKLRAKSPSNTTATAVKKVRPKSVIVAAKPPVQASSPDADRRVLRDSTGQLNNIPLEFQTPVESLSRRAEKGEKRVPGMLKYKKGKERENDENRPPTPGPPIFSVTAATPVRDATFQARRRSISLPSDPALLTTSARNSIVFVDGKKRKSLDPDSAQLAQLGTLPDAQAPETSVTRVFQPGTGEWEDDVLSDLPPRRINKRVRLSLSTPPEFVHGGRSPSTPSSPAPQHSAASFATTNESGTSTSHGALPVNGKPRTEEVLPSIPGSSRRPSLISVFSFNTTPRSTHTPSVLSLSERHEYRARGTAASQSSIPISAIIAARPESVSLSGRGSEYYIHSPSLPPSTKKAARPNSLVMMGNERVQVGSEGDQRTSLPLQGWCFFIGFLLPFVWWIGSFIKVRAMASPRQGSMYKAEEAEEVVWEELDMNAMAWRFRCRLMSFFSILVYIPVIVLAVVYTQHR